MFSLVATLVLGTVASLGQSEEGDLLTGFLDPPDEAKPRTWWHWIQGNVTHEGITKDLEWMKRVGLAGMQLADVNFGGGQTVEPKIEYGTAAWYDAVRHAAAEADRLGLEMSIFSSPGWSETGGPFVTPAQGMKRLTWTVTDVEGPSSFDSTLPQPSAHLDFYADAAVIAHPLPPGEINVIDLDPTVTSSGGNVDALALMDGDPASGMTVETGSDGRVWVQLEFAQPFTARAITLSARAGGRSGVPVGEVLAGDDAHSLRAVLSLPGSQLYRQGRIRTYAFPEATARIWQIELTGAPLDPALTMSQDPPRAVDSYQLNEATLHAGARVHRWEEKSVSSQFLFEYESVHTPAVPESTAVDPGSVVDLTSKMAADGMLKWDVPVGRWRILRLGYVPTGARNRPATGAGSGLEADKLSREHMEAYYHGYFDPIQDALGPLFGKSLRFVTMDSWEAGTQNWTDAMLAEFQRRRGYDPVPWLPVLTGVVVDNADLSDRFLWDFRRTLADLWAEYHYGTMTELLQQNGVGVYGEAAGVSLEIPEDTLLNKKNVTIPMGEFWLGRMHPTLMYLQEVRGAASAAHAYGKPIVAAESFTGGGYETPYALKQAADFWLSLGINRIVFHTSAHQPLDTKPGNTMVGTHINRNVTWAEQARPLMTYLARACHMLQQGKFVADLAYLLNEGAPSSPKIWGAGTTPPCPSGYSYDFINADVLLNRMTVGEDGRLLLPDGMTYRVLVLPETDGMRPELATKIRALVEGGATVVGPKPRYSPSLMGYPEADRELQNQAAAVWGDLDGESRTVRHIANGRVVWGRTLEDVLSSQGIEKDFDYGGPVGTRLVWLHRRTADAEIYYVANQTDRAVRVETSCRVTGREAEIWHPDSGVIKPASYMLQGGRTLVPLRLEAYEAVFVVFRTPTTLASRVIEEPVERLLGTIDGPWDVRFDGPGDPPSIQLTDLQPWSANTNDLVRYFSGTATYDTRVEIPAGWLLPSTRLILDLGEVGDLAEVSVNGKAMGTLWKPPFRVDVTDALTTGSNAVEVKVINQWINRIAGDRLLPEGAQVFAPIRGRRFVGRLGESATSLPASGLLGPVRVLAQTRP